MIRSFKLAAFGLAAALGLSAMGDGAQAQTRELTFGEFGPNRGTRAAGIEWLDSQLRERTGGELGLNIIWGGALLGAKTAAQGISDGVADMGSIVPVYAPGKLISYEAADVPQFGDEWVGMRAVHELMNTNEAALAEWDAANMVYLTNYTTGPTQLLSKEPIRTMSDLDGKTFRATGPFVAALESAGASTVSVGQPKVYEALSNGTVDGSTTYYYVMKAYKHYELVDYLTELNMGQVLAFGIAMNKASFESLKPEHQEIVKDLGDDFIDYMAAKMYESRQSVKAELQEGIEGHTVEIVEPDGQMRAELIAIAEKDALSWLDKAADKGMDGDAMLGEFRALIAKYSEERDAKGYPWER
ncbi:MAG: C4-dicarboxylate TRAP transporter substrate-binding protein [Marivibrio sp.]|uniref:C4-dicarboxylate TRAP transporter substrate-binding protein n=1 Tax=Marivibrio sp. TaxID=2039719 RepID=UPI0032ED97A5